MNKLMLICFLLFCLCERGVSQVTPAQERAATSSGAVSSAIDALFDYFAMAGTSTAADFKPLTQRERTRIYFKSLVNPVLYLKGGISGAIDLKNDKPSEWQHGATGWGIRTGNIMAQYGIQRSVTFGISSLLHEDNRYFGSGKKGFWRRIGYSMMASVSARHDNGRLYPSASLIGGFAASSFISRTWQPASSRSAADGAVSFGYCIGYNVLAGIAKEFLPDMFRPLLKDAKRAR